jgi:hypothetical protein
MNVELEGVQMGLLIRISEERGARLGRVIGYPHEYFLLSFSFPASFFEILPRC